MGIAAMSLRAEARALGYREGVTPQEPCTTSCMHALHAEQWSNNT